MLAILTGAKKNIGDYLIGERAKALLTHYVDEEIVEIDRFKPINPHLETINKCTALLLCGGPAYTSDIYPNIYPLKDILEEIKVPIIPFGLGWSGSPFHQPLEFRFTDEAFGFLKSVHEKISFSSCRDVITESILNDKGLDNVIMTGCPVWYYLPDIDKSYEGLANPEKIVFSTGAKQSLVFQTFKLLKGIKKRFSNSKVYVTYHRGILPGKHTPLRKGISYTIISLYAKLLGFSVLDVSSNLSKIDFYADCDLHIGYRVHAHLDFLSRKKPSYLINEDGRGLGMVRSLKLPEFNYDQPNIVDSLFKQLELERKNNFLNFKETFQTMKTSFSGMLEFLGYLKGL